MMPAEIKGQLASVENKNKARKIILILILFLFLMMSFLYSTIGGFILSFFCGIVSVVILYYINNGYWFIRLFLYYNLLFVFGLSIPPDMHPDEYEYNLYCNTIKLIFGSLTIVYAMYLLGRIKTYKN